MDSIARPGDMMPVSEWWVTKNIERSKNFERTEMGKKMRAESEAKRKEMLKFIESQQNNAIKTKNIEEAKKMEGFKKYRELEIARIKYLQDQEAKEKKLLEYHQNLIKKKVNKNIIKKVEDHIKNFQKIKNQENEQLKKQEVSNSIHVTLNPQQSVSDNFIYFRKFLKYYDSDNDSDYNPEEDDYESDFEDKANDLIIETNIWYDEKLKQMEEDKNQVHEKQDKQILDLEQQLQNTKQKNLKVEKKTNLPIRPFMVGSEDGAQKRQQDREELRKQTRKKELNKRRKKVSLFEK